MWTVLFVVLCLAASAATWHVLNTDDPAYREKGTIGQKLIIAGAELTVEDVEVGTVLTNSYGKFLATTPGMFVAVDLHVACPGRSVNPISTVLLHAGDRTYGAWDVGGGPLPDGYQLHTRAVFEIDPADIGSLTLESSATELFTYYPRHAWVDLKLANRAEELRGEARGKIVQESAGEQEPIP